MDRIKHLRKKKFNPLQLDKIIYLPIGILVITIAAAVFLLTMPSYVECIGKLIPKEYYPIYSKANGLVISNNVIDGMRVKKGDFLFCLDNKTLFLNIQQLSLQTNDLHIQLKYLTQELKLLEKDKQVSVSILKKQYDNNRMLFKNDSISKEILDQSYLKYKNEDSGYQKQYNEITKSIDLQNNQLNQLEVVIEEKNILLSNTYYYTPIDGYIIYLAHFENTYQRDNDNFLKVKLQEGSFINDGTLVFYLVPDASLNAEIMIPEDKIYDVDISNDVILYFSSLPYQKFNVFKGKLADISKSVKEGKFIGTVNIDKQDFQKAIVRGEEMHFDVFFINASLKAKIQGRKKALYRKLFNLP